MDDPAIRRERLQNLWRSFTRKHPPAEHATGLDPEPDLPFEDIGGLAAAKEEILTYACAATDPDVYRRWGTQPPTALLLIGSRGAGKSLLARALASRARMPFLTVSVPRVVLEVVQSGSKVGELLGAWAHALDDLGPTTVFFDELEFSQVQDIGTQRTDLPIGPIMDFLLELVARTVAAEGSLVLGSTSYPQSLRPAFLAPGRFERVVEVTPVFPEDVVEALGIHARHAEKRAGRDLFEDVDWTQVVTRYRQPSTGDWVRILHGTLRRKARLEAAGEAVSPVSTADLLREVDRARHADSRLLPAGGTYL